MHWQSSLDDADQKVEVWRYMMISPYQGSRVVIKKRVSLGSCSLVPISREAEGKEQINSINTSNFFDLA